MDVIFVFTMKFWIATSACAAVAKLLARYLTLLDLQKVINSGHALS